MTYQFARNLKVQGSDSKFWVGQGSALLRVLVHKPLGKFVAIHIVLFLHHQLMLQIIILMAFNMLILEFEYWTCCSQFPYG